MRRRRLLIIFILLALAAGCSDGLPFGDVVGRVTLDGQPIQQGSVRFVPLDGNTPTAGAIIQNGQFKARVPVSQCKVEISAAGAPKASPRQSSLTIDGADASATLGGGELLPELVPARYNTQSELKLNVQSGLNEPQFDLRTN